MPVIETPRHQVVELQSLRGFAATLVLLHHSLRTVQPSPITAFVSDRLLDAQAAVVFFFVLSGYVLTASLAKRPLETPEIIGFYIRRIFRIYPAIWIACLAVVVAMFAVPPPGGALASTWIQSYHLQGLAPVGAIALSFLALSLYVHPMLWTMFVELNASLFMPVIRAAQQRGAHWILVLVLGLSAISFLLPGHTKLVSVYLVTFAIGGAVPHLASAVARLRARSRVAESVSLVAALAILLWFRELLPHARWQAFDPLIVQVEAVAAMWIVALAVHRPHGFPSLRHRAVVWLGDISYGIYLLHFPILLIAVAAAERFLPADIDRTALGAGIAGVVLVVTVAASAACYAAVELPAVALGARVARLVRRRMSESPSLGLAPR